MGKRDFPCIHPGEILLCKFLLSTGPSRNRLACNIRVTPEELQDGFDNESHPFTNDD